MRKYVTAALLTTIFLAGCQSEPESPRHVIAGFDTAPRIPIPLKAFDATAPRGSQTVPSPNNGSQTGSLERPGINLAQLSAGEQNIPPPWMLQQPQAPFYYWNNFYYQWPFYYQSYFAPRSGPFDTRYNRYGEQVRPWVAPATLKLYQQQSQRVSPLSRQELSDSQEEQSAAGDLKIYQMQQPYTPANAPRSAMPGSPSNSGLKLYQMR